MATSLIGDLALSYKSMSNSIHKGNRQHLATLKLVREYSPSKKTHHHYFTKVDNLRETLDYHEVQNQPVTYIYLT